ncbi:uncharacterized protein FFFS_06107 [Fusarium fujikuroi]|nr:uncharacterized protein FFFS_06107 [Fusarium fujikuroi]
MLYGKIRNMLQGNIATRLPTKVPWPFRDLLTLVWPNSFPPWRIDMNPSISRQIDRLPFWFLLGCRFTFRLAWDYSVRICPNKTLVLNPLFLKHKESSALLKYERLQAAISELSDFLYMHIQCRRRHKTQFNISRL